MIGSYMPAPFIGNYRGVDGDDPSIVTAFSSIQGCVLSRASDGMADLLLSAHTSARAILNPNRIRSMVAQFTHTTRIFDPPPG